jgi:hypothetical protein
VIHPGGRETLPPWLTFRSANIHAPAVSAALGLSATQRRGAIGLLAVAAAAQLRLFLPFEREMKRTGGPGIIPFELAGSTERAREILNIWGPQGCAAARKSLLLDYIFPPTYAALQALACDASAEGFARRDRRFLATAGLPIGWGQVSAAAFDYVENTALLLVLAGRDRQAPRVARRAAQVKFALTSLGQAYILFAGIDAGLARGRQ